MWSSQNLSHPAVQLSIFSDHITSRLFSDEKERCSGGEILHDANESDWQFDSILKCHSRDCSSIVLCDECVYSSDEQRGDFVLGTYWVRTGGKQRAWVEIMELQVDKEALSMSMQTQRCSEAVARRWFCTVLYRDVGELCVRTQEKGE